MHLFDRRQALAAACATWPLTNLLGQNQTKDPYFDGKLIPGEPPLPASGSFTLAVLPDTQHYSERYPATYLAQTQWIVDSREKRNIAGVLHLGDITNNNKPAEWENAQRAMRQLDGKVPYFMCPGNHDYSLGGGCTDRTTLMNNYFPMSDYRTRPQFGGAYDKEPDHMENTFHTMKVNDRNLLVLALEFGPRRDVVRWANEVAAKHSKHEIILITHAFIYSDDTRYDWKKYGANQKWNPHAYPVAKATRDDVCDGEDLWNLLISKHENFVLTLNGHVLNDGLGKFISKTPGGRAVPQILVNYQMRPKGGDGWLRLLEFKKDRQTVEVYDYSPTRKQQNVSEQNRMTLTLAGI